MKKTYLAPGMIMVQLQHKQHLLVDSVHALSSNADINYGGAGDGDGKGGVRKERGARGIRGRNRR